MSAVALVNAERIKLTTTASSLWIAAVVAALGLALAAIQGDGLAPQRAAMGVAVFGVPVLMVFASMTVTSEYRSGMIRTTFIAAPHRVRVLGAKAVVVLVFSSAYAAVLVVASFLVAGLSLNQPQVWRLTGVIALYAALAAVLGVGVGALLRAGPGAVAVLLLWPLVVEPVLGDMPDVGPVVGPYLPFANIFLVIDVPWLYPGHATPWGPAGSVAYFAAFVAVVFAAALVVLHGRDA